MNFSEELKNKVNGILDEDFDNLSVEILRISIQDILDHRQENMDLKIRKGETPLKEEIENVSKIKGIYSSFMNEYMNNLN